MIGSAAGRGTNGGGVMHHGLRDFGRLGETGRGIVDIQRWLVGLAGAMVMVLSQLGCVAAGDRVCLFIGYIRLVDRAIQP